MTRTIVIGHSHCNAIAQALAAQPGEVHNISVYRIHGKYPSEQALTTGEAVNLLSGLPSDARVFLAVLGAYHNVLGLLASGQTFDFLLNPEDTPDPQASVQVPHRAIESAFKEQFAHTSKVETVIRAAKCPAFLLSSPPPKRSNEFVLQRFMSQKRQVYRGKSVEQFGIERANTRLKLWRMEEHLMAQWAEAQGIRFVAAPEAAMDSDGFLKEQYFDDVTHANSAYGALVLEQITEIVQGGGQVLHG